MKKPPLEFPRSYRQNDLFRPASATDMNACVGTNGGPYDFSDYALGYFEVAKAAIDSARDRKTHVDIVVYPVAYCYRHGVELWLKYFANHLPQLFDEQPQTKATHRLEDNWLIVRRLLKRHGRFDPDGDALDFLDNIIRDIQEFDPNAEVFRFPLSKNGEGHLQDASIINLEVLGSAMDSVGQIFDYFETILQQDLQAKWEYGRRE